MTVTLIPNHKEIEMILRTNADGTGTIVMADRNMGTFLKGATITMVAGPALPQATISMEDLEFEGTVVPECIVFADANVFDKKDGIRIELNRRANKQAGWVRYLDGSQIYVTNSLGKPELADIDSVTISLGASQDVTVTLRILPPS